MTDTIGRHCIESLEPEWQPILAEMHYRMEHPTPDYPSMSEIAHSIRNKHKISASMLDTARSILERVDAPDYEDHIRQLDVHQGHTSWWKQRPCGSDIEWICSHCIHCGTWIGFCVPMGEQYTICRSCSCTLYCLAHLVHCE